MSEIMRLAVDILVAARIDFVENNDRYRDRFKDHEDRYGDDDDSMEF